MLLTGQNGQRLSQASASVGPWKRWGRRTGLVATSALLALSLSATPAAMTLRLSIGELCSMSSLVALLRIEAISESVSEGELSIVTAEARVLERWKGDLSSCGSVIQIREWVGLSTAVEYSPGEKLIAFLDRRESCVFRTLGASQGRLLVEGDQVRMADGTRRGFQALLAEIKAALATD